MEPEYAMRNASSIAIQATRKQACTKTSSGVSQISARTAAAVIGAATKNSSAIPARSRLWNGSRALMTLRKEILRRPVRRHGVGGQRDDSSELCGSDLKPSLSAWLTYSANAIVTAMATCLN